MLLLIIIKTHYSKHDLQVHIFYFSFTWIILLSYRTPFVKSISWKSQQDWDYKMP